MRKEKIVESLKKALEGKGERKFTQSVELAINFKGIDFNKQENRLNLEVALPKGRGKEQKVAVFADGQVALDARNAGVDLIISGDDIPRLAGDSARLKTMLEYEFLAQPSLMAAVAKNLGQVLGTKGKLPKPLVGINVKDAAERARKVVKIKSKGKYLPVVHCLIGKETMSAEDLADNADAILEAVKGKTGEQAIKSVYVKLTMGKPQRIEL